MDSWRWWFTMLMFYDLVKLIKPDGSGRVDHLMLQEIRGRWETLQGQTFATTEMALQQINGWSC